jgi:hypothetical protein
MLKVIVITLLQISQKSELISSLTFQLLSVLNGLSKLVKEEVVKDEFTKEMLIYLLFRLPLSNIVVMKDEEDYENILTKRARMSYKGPKAWFKNILQESIDPTDGFTSGILNDNNNP